jgi:HK97 family phage prohead protease
MPYFVTDQHPNCPAWATVKEGGELVACHGSEQDAIDQMVAISVAEDIVPGGTYEGEFRQIDLSPPEFMREAARQGLRYYEQGLAGDGLTSRTVREARSMAAGEVSEDKWVRIAAWISRHLGDLDSPAADPDNEDYPSAGVVAHLLWGSGPSKEAANRALAYATRIVLRIKNENEANMLDNSVMDTRAEIGELAVDDIVRWIVGDDVKFGQVASVSDTTVEIVVWDEEDGVWYATELTAVVDVAVLEKLDGLPEPEMDEEDMSSRSHNKFETRLNVTNFEIRETADGMLFEGYASVFNSRSENLGGFTEFVAPGAFTRSLKSRNDVKLLWNHDAGQVLGSTRAKTMTLVEDERGLKVSATLPNTSLGRDTAELIRTGIIDSMSFGFNVIKDSWNAEGNERTLHSVRLFEVSVVAFPAYAATAGSTSVRSVEKLAKRAEVDMAELEAALIKLESGQDLDEASRDLLNNVINKVSPSVTFEPEQDSTVVGDLGLLALKKKKLELLDL